MPNSEDIRKTIGGSSAVHFAAGTVDLAAEKLRGLPAAFDKLKADTPGKVESFRENDLPKLRERGRNFAEQGAETAREYASKARETYAELAERGRGPVEEWARGTEKEDGEAEEGEAKVVVERVEKVIVTEVPDDASSLTGDGPDAPGGTGTDGGPSDQGPKSS
ncbi:hypothetical protein [Streptomyces spiramenti]|uniref:Uncharacterized protein n=1 Tax=Streptomyces spiramenti TaxID=2720606 RepID=A0ABX1ARS4_9ACTN|nr:hypothetical protein [Streptomyces spiramenti]NJP67002.1 hypothetical protein [Streptomyces spiramenti]